MNNLGEVIFGGIKAGEIFWPAVSGIHRTEPIDNELMLSQRRYRERCKRRTAQHSNLQPIRNPFTKADTKALVAARAARRKAHRNEVAR